MLLLEVTPKLRMYRLLLATIIS